MSDFAKLQDDSCQPPGTDALIAEARANVRQVVEAARAAGFKIEAAWETAATALGLKARRVRAYWADDVTSISAAEYVGIKHRVRTWLAQDIARRERDIAQMRAWLTKQG